MKHLWQVIKENFIEDPIGTTADFAAIIIAFILVYLIIK